MRRLPIYFLLDVSESMIGDPIEQVQDGIATIIKELRTDPHALETVYISIIVFAGKAKKITPLIELYNFYPPKLPIGGGTGLGNALNFLMDDIDSAIQKTTYEKKGDWKPIVFLFTDGNPTDNTDHAFDRWNKNYKNKANLVSIILGDNTDTSLFAKITDHVMRLETTTPEAFKNFFKWITASIKTSSISVSSTGIDDLKLASLPDNLTKIDLEKSGSQIIDENFAVILGRCQNTKRLYLIKYQKRLNPSPYGNIGLNTRDFKLVGAYPIDDTYFELRNQYGIGNKNTRINTDELIGFPACPCCGNQYGFSHCSCGNIMCTGGEQLSTCPWCEIQAEFKLGEGNTDINRTQG